jgi:uncharacterized protein
MRLSAGEIEAIRAAAREVLGPEARVWVFGSRIDDRLRGGDLDLLIEVAPGQTTPEIELALRDRIEPALDDLRVDIVFHERGTPLAPIAEIALRDGAPL